MQVSVRKRLGDQSTLVREATVDLLGRFILTQPEISQQYYDMLSERILVSFNYHIFLEVIMCAYRIQELVSENGLSRFYEIFVLTCQIFLS